MDKRLRELWRNKNGSIEHIRALQRIGSVDTKLLAFLSQPAAMKLHPNIIKAHSHESWVTILIQWINRETAIVACGIGLKTANIQNDWVIEIAELASNWKDYRIKEALNLRPEYTPRRSLPYKIANKLLCLMITGNRWRIQSTITLNALSWFGVNSDDIEPELIKRILSG